MSLTICSTHDGRLVPGPAEAALRRALGERGRALLLVPSFSEQLAASEQLAERGGLSLGVTVTTPAAWVAERWEVWGDGRRIVDASARAAELSMVLEANTRGVQANQGTVRLLARLASDALPWLPRNERGDIDRSALAAAGLTNAEAAAVELLDEYEERLDQAGLVEESRASAQVVGRLRSCGGSVWPTVAVGFLGLTCPQRELLAALAATTNVTLVAPEGNSAAEEARDASFEELMGRSADGGVPVELAAPQDEDPLQSVRDPELEALRERVFMGSRRHITPTGAVSLLTPAGPLAEAEAITWEVLRLRDAGMGDVVVSVPDATRAWRELSPKLPARGVAVSATLSEPFSSLEAGRAFLEFAEEVGRLSELAATWPEPVETDEGTLLRLGDMSWWPPRALTDFLLSDIAHMDRRRAHNLDRRWRQDRLLTPTAVLETLQNPGKTSPAVAGATSELLRGRLGSAASRLLAPFAGMATTAAGARMGKSDGLAEDGETSEPAANAAVPPTQDPLAVERATKALEAVMGAARTLKQLGVTADPAAERAVTVSELVARTKQLLSGTSVVTRPAIEPDGATCQVRIVTARDLPALGAASADAVIMCGQTSAQMPVGTGDDVASALLEKLDVEFAPNPMAAMRTAFWHGLGVARRHVTLERTLFDADSKDAYPSVMLSEVLACYDPGRLEDATLAETGACRNLSSTGRASRPVASEVPAAAGAVTGPARLLINVPREGQPRLPEGKPVLSASQIESYLECPYKWFSLRRLRLEDSDVGFAPVQMGTFAHRVLEVTHAKLLAEGLDAMGGASPDVNEAPECRVPGSRVSMGDPEGIAHAKRLLADELDAHTRHMFLKRRKGDPRSALVPHTAQDEGLLHTLRRDLESVVDYEAGMLVGFEPRFFEWDFGKAEPEPYAGAYIRGTVDRIDVSAHGGAVVIDYKHRKGSGLMGEYAAFAGDDGAGKGTGAFRHRETTGDAAGDEAAQAAEAGVDVPFALPRHVQSLIYGQVVRRHFAQLHVQGAVYLTTGGQSHVLSGAVDADQLDRVYGEHLPTKKALPGVAVERDQTFGQEGERGMDALLDATEQAIGDAIARMMAGDIEARPLDARACEWCPVMNCERRLSK